MLKAIIPRAAARWSRVSSLSTRFDVANLHPLNNLLHTKSRRGYAESRLDFVAIDRKWQQKWASQKVGKARKKEKDGAKNMYILPMFPYPSGHLHLGHLRVYTIADVLSRFRRMKGHNVLHPMGWDAFGLPAENAAIERGIDPAVWTKQNIANMKSQLQSMNGDWDWDRELATCDPKFYKHTQQIFLMLHERGLAYQAESLVNYDPVDKTVLANEQVDANGCSWRSGAKVEKRMLKQWFLRISEFRQALLDDLDHLSKDNLWPERVLSMQRNWLGKSEGARIKFPVMSLSKTTLDPIEVFTTRPDTLFGVQYLALASTHPIVLELAKNDKGLQSFLHEMPSLPQESKTGYLLGNIRGINPLAYDKSTPNETKASLPIYVAPYVLGDYGDGAVMGVPGHDARDHAFWKTNCGDGPVRMVVQPLVAEPTSAITEEPFLHRGVLNSKCGPFSGQASTEASQNIINILNKDAKLAMVAETWRLRDWLVSRQRYWGTPIPIVHCDKCGAVPVPEDQLPVELPIVEGHWLKGKAGNPLEDAHDWVNAQCPSCRGKAKRDTDTMDTFVDSSWYFMRFPDCHNEDAPFSPNSAEKHLPVDLYIGGVEHAILHLLYARFISKFLSTKPLWSASSISETKGEPFKQLITQGMVHGKTYSDPSTGRFLKPDEVDLSTPARPTVIATGEFANTSFEKMSKSKYNGVNPNTCFSKYGADATRAHILFQAPISEVLEWDEEKIVGITRWLKRIHDQAQNFSSTSINSITTQPKHYFTENLTAVASWDKPRLNIWDAEVELWLIVQRTIITITDSLSQSYNLNTVVSDLMSLTNIILSSKTRSCDHELQYYALKSLLQMMAPITPAFAEECWELLHSSHQTSPAISQSVFEEDFPEPDGTLEILQRRTQPCAVQINGKFKFAVDIPFAPEGIQGKDLEKWVTEQVMGSEEGKSRLSVVDFEKVRKVIVVKGGRTVNYVV